MKVAIYGNSKHQHFVTQICDIVACLMGSGIDLVAEALFADFLQDADPGLRIPRADELPADSELLLSFGGDGTFLQAVRWAGTTGVPVLGVNAGHLGYLSALPMPSSPQILADMLLARDWLTEERAMLAVKVHGEDTPPLPFALNEVALLKEHSASTITCSAFLDGQPVAVYPGDGILVSTPTGSTAYNLSAGGPVVEPTLGISVITPIASHTLTLRPLVVSSERTLRVCVQSRTGYYQLAIDGAALTLPEHASVSIEAAPCMARVARAAGSHWLSTLSQKLLWGARP